MRMTTRPMRSPGRPPVRRDLERALRRVGTGRVAVSASVPA